ncbi:DNA-processing protein DprA [Actinoplanes sp. NPDC020271]|uniref:DNA-processing protein DprA n=1 Tax=Actinoplanes sp. NPDC020271 TaxID=3363896 RepID=UPI003794F1D7
MVEQHGAPTALRQVLTGDVADPALRDAAMARLTTGDPLRHAEIALRRAESIGARLIVPTDREWPAAVNDLALVNPGAPGTASNSIRPPLCLWVRGDRLVNEAFAQAVSIVGARAATTYGAHVSGDLAYGLANSRWTVVSGGSYGVEAAAHRGALAAGGSTAVVLAGGMDRPYPAGNSAMFDQIAACGLLISEWPPGAEPIRHRFLLRNRVLAAMAGTVLVEAAPRSGSLQAMNRALALSRPAMVVPGPVTSQMSKGCHELLRTNPAVRVVTSVDDVLAEIAQRRG